MKGNVAHRESNRAIALLGNSSPFVGVLDEDALAVQFGDADGGHDVGEDFGEREEREEDALVAHRSGGMLICAAAKRLRLC